jgi:hypothetical protein
MPPLHPRTPPQTPHEPHVHLTQISWIQAQEPKPDLVAVSSLFYAAFDVFFIGPY